MPKLRNGSKVDSNPGSLDGDSGVLPLSYRSKALYGFAILHRVNMCIRVSAHIHEELLFHLINITHICVHPHILQGHVHLYIYIYIFAD